MTNSTQEAEVLLEKLVNQLILYPEESLLGTLQSEFESCFGNSYNRESIQRVAHESFVFLKNEYGPELTVRKLLENIKENYNYYVDLLRNSIKSLSAYENDAAVSSTKNRRRYLEDAFLIVTRLKYFLEEDPTTPEQKSGNLHEASLYVILDGHGGKDVACFCQKFIGVYAAREILLQDNKNLSLDKILERIVDEFNEKMRKNYSSIRSGSTITMCIVDKKRIYSAWRGDSKAYYVLKDGSNVPIVTTNHSLNDYDERMLVTNNSDPSILYSKGIFFYNGLTSVSRMMGDFFIVTYQSTDSFCYKYKGSHGLVIMATDGLWDVLKINEVSQIFSQNQNLNPQEALNLLKTRLKSELLVDNVTMIIFSV